MKHRGRHRRRRRGRALRAVLAGTALALTAAATMISASQATDVRDPGALKPLTGPADTEPLRLTEEPVPQQWLDRLSDEMGRPVGVTTVLEDSDGSLRQGRDCPEQDRKALPVEPAATRAYCFGVADTTGLRPGGVTTSGDADDDGYWGAHRVILSGWTENSGAPDGSSLARVAVVDADDLSYAWALLAVPAEGGRDYRPLGSPVSGMVWYQDKLLVTAGPGDDRVLYVYDVGRIQRATVDGPWVGRVPGGWSAAGARYVLPAVASYRAEPGAAAPRPGGISLDRSTAPDSLVTYEARRDGEGTTRLWRYDFSGDPERTGLLATDSVLRAKAAEAYETRLDDVHGVLSYRSDWYLSGAGTEADERGTLWRQDTEGARPTRCGPDETLRCWSGPPAPLALWQSTGEVWARSGRTLFAFPLTSVDRT
ncbi:hypothetical protein GCM10009535_37900 [Streptomyces thermocarboxydovorans]|uniref:Secreted protein n=1 Tax=Streptomyces thermocarboxydovorans TaxID=59298 RepID=A0ABP3SR74_9ACTN